MKVTAAGTLWVRAEHVGSMATTTTDDILAVYDDAAVGAVAKLRAPAMALHGIGHEQTNVGRTQCMPLSAAVVNRRSADRERGTQRMLMLTVADE